jgi:hypothetical protein
MNEVTVVGFHDVTSGIIGLFTNDELRAPTPGKG